jgi:hypothetical protein
MKPELHATLAKLSRDAGIPMAWFIEKVLREALEARTIEVMPRDEALALQEAKLEAKQADATKAASGIFTF